MHVKRWTRKEHKTSRHKARKKMKPPNARKKMDK